MNYGYYHNNHRYCSASFVGGSNFETNTSSSKPYNVDGGVSEPVRPKIHNGNDYSKFDENKDKPSLSETTRNVPRGRGPKSSAKFGRRSSQVGYTSSTKYAAGYCNGSNYNPAPLKNNWHYDEKTASSPRYTCKPPKYSNLESEHLPKGLYTVKVNLPNLFSLIFLNLKIFSTFFRFPVYPNVASKGSILFFSSFGRSYEYLRTAVERCRN